MLRPQRCLALLFILGAASEWSQAGALKFETDIRPMLKAACFHCHGEDEVTEGGLDVRLVRLMVEGGDTGSAIVPGDSRASLLWKRIAEDEMPEGEKKLSEEEKNLLRRWIDQGAQTARPEPANVKDARFTLEELEHWAFQPVQSHNPPPGEANPIDAFVVARLAEEGFGFSERADRATLIRRLTFDLTGLPPSPAEVTAFVSATAPNAYEELVERLLASPQHGVRWARHWLDAAGYAESDGFELNARKRPHAWRYRDYVINAFNTNKPIDQFIIEQLAGDELIEGEPNVHNPRHLELLTATGFLRLAPDPTQRTNDLMARNTAVANTIEIVGTSLLGVTVGCAQCHDHKYDPIGSDDYYSFRAIFDPAFPLEKWRQPESRLIDLTTPDVNAKRAEIEEEAKKLDAALAARRKAHAEQIQKQKLAEVPEGDRDATREAVLTNANERTSRQKELLELYPMVKPVSFIAGFLVEYDNAAYREFQEEQNAIAAVRAKKPPVRMVMATTEPRGEPPVSHVLFRGDPGNPQGVAEPAEIMVLKRNRTKPPAIQGNQAELKTTGRRLAYARQLTDGGHPLTARVFVNRVWMHHFGRGLVATPGDFGIAGERPSHPKLLDWLAADFVANGWDIKRLHRLIVHSKTFQQQSRRREDLDRVDPDNILLGRANLKRLEAEAIRDAILAVSGQIDLSLGGAAVPVVANSDGKAVIGAEGVRRSVFVETQRRLPLNMLDTFDQPVMSPSCDQRRHTTVATQALWFLNDEEAVSYAGSLAQAVRLSAAPDASDAAVISKLYFRLFAKAPTREEMISCERFLERQRTHLADADQAADPNHLAVASLCQVLLASNRFLYLD